MLPETFKRRIKVQSYIDAELLFEALEKQSPVSIRINTDKWSHSPVLAQAVPWCKSGYYLDERPSFTLDPLFHAGCYYPQEASGMFLEQVFRQLFRSDEYIRALDLCGAPGGKSTHLSSLIGGKGFLVANEVIRQRSLILAENITKWGLSNCIVTQSDPSVFGNLPGFFDLMLVDAPCSGEGMFRDQVARDEWSADNVKLCPERQRRILSGSWPALKENGILVYSTCTFNPSENEENVKWLVSNRDAETVKIDISGFAGITEIIHEGVYGYGFHPGRIRGDGLFISVVRKRGSADIAARRSRKSIQKLSREDSAMASALFKNDEDRFIKSGDRITGLPCSREDFGTLSEVLRIVKPGTGILQIKNNGIVPLHDLALSVLNKQEVFPSEELDLNDALAYLRRDNFGKKFHHKGWNIVKYKGVNLGFVNNIGTRFNNYYPVEWRIRMAVPDHDKKSILDWK
jgi:16S rRNA C967 or C1407 C5-methylase (RsmB/RsmF family)/NOL1/NOP2/fmu family ribosome biogenesis protein